MGMTRDELEDKLVEWCLVYLEECKTPRLSVNAILWNVLYKITNLALCKKDGSVKHAALYISENRTTIAERLRKCALPDDELKELCKKHHIAFAPRIQKLRWLQKNKRP